ncbi:acyltransferase family protein [Bacillaceae bacterium CLA-AA-H227]|uniref:Acyltransferase family protein n=1 Tax=Robertmurraya yapensis (ex Hitch et al 2024) TaxID=3133160 RepID=A0ACC6SEV0_9BACI
MTSNERHSGLDIVRTLATLLVLSVHFFGNTYFYTTPLIGKNMHLETFFRMSFMICVPLFLILTGYLQANKIPNKNYYKKILPIIIIYSLLSILYTKIFRDEDKSVLEYIYSIFNFSANGYSWYINMYIGLFLISPFLNILFKNIPTRKIKLVLIGILLLITSLPNFLNTYISNKIFFSADYWVQMYPITYYFIGSFLKEYQIRINKSFGIIIFVILSIIEVWIEFFYAKGGNIVFATGSYPSLIIVFQSIIFFLIFYDLDVKYKVFKKLFALISILSLDIYLASFITDKIVYGYFLDKHSNYTQQILFFYAPVLVVSTFILAFSLAVIRNKLIRIR